MTGTGVRGRGGRLRTRTVENRTFAATWRAKRGHWRARDRRACRLLGGRRMRASLRGGTVVIVVVMFSAVLDGASRARAEEPDSAAGDCSPETLGAALRDLFPPAPPSVRAFRATQIGACHPAGGDGALAAAARLTRDTEAAQAVVRALGSFSSPVAAQALREAARPDGAAAVRGTAIEGLAKAGDVDTVLRIIGDRDEGDQLRMQALSALARTKGPPSAAYLRWLRPRSGPALCATIDELAAELVTPLPRAPVAAVARPAEAAPVAAAPHAGAERPAPIAVEPEAPAQPRGPTDGSPLAIGASTVAGAALMVNLSLLGVRS